MILRCHKIYISIVTLNYNNIDALGWKSDESAALLSLRTALQAYFETYRATYEDFSNPLKFDDAILQSEFESDLYKSLYFTTITHFQNFFELCFKKILNQFEDVNPHIKFFDVLNHLIQIKENNEIGEIKCYIESLLEKKNDVDFLNKLRNRIWHGGVFYLSYSKLDMFVCQKILPLVTEIVSKEYVSENNLWKYKSLNAGIDPIDFLIKEASTETPDMAKIALYKEMGRAAYHNPMIQMGNCDSMLKKAYETHMNEEWIRETRAKTDAVCKEFYFADVYSCPVCGQKTLIKHEISDVEEGRDEKGNEIPLFYFIPERIKCETCSFEIVSNIIDLEACGIDEPDFWERYIKKLMR